MSDRLRFTAPRMAPEFDFKSQKSVEPLLRPVSEEQRIYEHRSLGQKARWARERAERAAEAEREERTSRIMAKVSYALAGVGAEAGGGR